MKTSPSDEAFMREAIRLSEKGMEAGDGGPFGAVIVREGKIIARGWNRVLGTNDPTAHAEVVAIRRASRKLGAFHLEGCRIYSSCEPCPMCLAAIHWAGIREVYFANTQRDAARIGFDDAKLYRELSKPPERREMRCVPLLREEARGAFRAWVEKPDRVPY